MSKLRPVSVLLAGFLVLFLAWTAYWVSAANRLRTVVEDWAARERVAGASVHWSGLAIDGFPTELAVTVRSLELKRQDGGTLYAGVVRVATLPWRPLTAAIDVGTGLKATRTVGDFPAVVLRAPAAAGDLRLTPDGRVQGWRLRLAQPEADVVGSRVSAADLELRVDGMPGALQGETVPTMILTGTDLTLPIAPPYGPKVARLAVRLIGKGPPPASLATGDIIAWSRTGGAVDVVIDTVDIGRMRLTGDATVALDNDLQPIGAGTVQLIGFEALVDGLAATGRLKPDRAPLVKAGLGLLAKPTADGSLQLTAPLTLQNRTLTLGPLSLAEIPRVAWP